MRSGEVDRGRGSIWGMVEHTVRFVSPIMSLPPLLLCISTRSNGTKNAHCAFFQSPHPTPPLGRGDPTNESKMAPTSPTVDGRDPAPTARGRGSSRLRPFLSRSYEHQARLTKPD